LMLEIRVNLENQESRENLGSRENQEIQVSLENLGSREYRRC
jgi:hypothetical protein